MQATGRIQQIPELGETEEKANLPLWGTSPRSTVVWAIAGFDPSSGAGVTADLLTFAAHGLFGCSALTAMTVQTTLGVFAWEPVRTELLEETLQRLGEDLPPAGIKIGMLGTAELAGVVGKAVAQQTADAGLGRSAIVVLDPVLRASSGKLLFAEDELAMWHTELLPHVDWLTPNWAELALLAGQPVREAGEAEEAARSLLKRYPKLSVVATGGDQAEPHDLLLQSNGTATHLTGTRVETSATHGTGCAYSSALLSALVSGMDSVSAATQAKAFVERALRWAPGIGHGKGPMELLWPLRSRGAA